MIYIDAHNHLQDQRLAPFLAEILPGLASMGLAAAVVNGTRESDWNSVAVLAGQHTWVIPSFGLHPWHVATHSPAWKEQLAGYLDDFPKAAIGEAGLDRWIEGHDLPLQEEIFAAHLDLAQEFNRPLTIHCLKAWGALWDLLRARPAPPRGFLLHSYGGPAEMVHGFVRQGAYFSFSPAFLAPRKRGVREIFRQIPLERLLLETDAPDMRPPAEQNPHPLADADTHEPLNDPRNIQLAYEALAGLRDISPEILAIHVQENFARLFQSGH